MNWEARNTWVVIVGQGYVGLPLAMAAHSAGMRVTGVDTNNFRVDQIRTGDSPVPDVNPVELQNALRGGAYGIQTDYNNLHGFDVAVITVPTPLVDGKPNLDFIRAAGAAIGQVLSRRSLIVLESTTYPGTTEELLVPILENASGLEAGKDFFVGYSPERIDPGNEMWNLGNTPKVTSGVNPASAEAVEVFYQSLGIETVPVSGTKEAELAKLLENTFRHVNIALVNEIAMFSRELDVDVWEAIEAASTKPFGFMKFSPGPGVGGHCLPVDPSYLSWAIREKSGKNFRFVELANAVNSYMPNFVVGRSRELLAKVGQQIESSRILLGGLSYKPKTADIRESPALVVAKLLHDEGASVYAVDEYVREPDWPDWIGKHSDGNCHYSLGIILTAHSRQSSQIVERACEIVLDTRNASNSSTVHKL